MKRRGLLLLAVVLAIVPLLLVIPGVSASGSQILVYAGNDALDEGYTQFGTAVGLPVDTQSTLPTDLSSYACIVLPINNAPFSSSQKSALTSYVHGGGHVIAEGEWAGFSSADATLAGFSSADATMNDLATAMGATMTLGTDAIDGGYHSTTQIDPSPLTAGVHSVGYAATDSVAISVAVSGTAQSLVRTSATGDKPNTTFIAAQQIGSGTLVVSGDSNVFSDSNFGSYSQNDNGVLAKNVCLKSLQQYSVVPLSDTSKAKKADSTYPITIQVNDGNGTNVSSADLVVHAVSLTMGTQTISPVPAPGNSQPDGNFTFDPTLGSGGGYQFNVKTTGLAPGTWTLNFTIGSDSTSQSTSFVVR